MVAKCLQKLLKRQRIYRILRIMLVEFGMGMAVANQMANSMNLALNKMTVPGAGKMGYDVTESIIDEILKLMALVPPPVPVGV